MIENGVLKMEKLASLLVVFVLVSSLAAGASQAERMINGSEPAFLKNIGPQDERKDNPVAAGIVAFFVALLLYKGFREARKDREKDQKMDNV